MDSDSNTYDASGLKTSFHGVVYQLKLVMLFAMRGHSKGYNFRLATEMDAAEKFDDVVFQYKDQANPNGVWNWRFLQAKHRLGSKKISINELISNSDTDFALAKYFISFCLIKNQDLFKGANLVDFIIVTNTEMDFAEKLNDIDYNNVVNEWKGYFEEVESLKNDEILSFKNDENNNVKYSKIKNDAKPLLSDVFNWAITMKALAMPEMKYLKSIENFIYVNCMYELTNKIENAISDKNMCIKLKKSIVLREMKKVQELQRKIQNAPLQVDVETVIKSLGTARTDNKINESLLVASHKTQEIVAKSKYLVDAYSDHSSVEYVALESEKKFCDADKLTKLKNQVSVATNDTDINNMKIEIAKSLELIVTKNTIEAIEKDNDDIEEKRRELIKILRKIIPNISLISLALQNDRNVYVDEFLEKFRFVMNYPNEEKLHNFLRNEFSSDDEFNLLDADFVNATFSEEMLKVLNNYNQGRSEFYSGGKAKDLFKSIKSKIASLITVGIGSCYPDKLKKYGIQFQENVKELNDFLSNENKEHQVFFFTTQSTRLTALKVYHTLINLGAYKQYDSNVFIRLRSMLRPQIQEYILQSFEAVNSHENRQLYGLLVIECQEKDRIEDEEPDLFQNLKNILRKNQTKKLVLIAKNGDIAKYFGGSFKKKCQIVDDRFEFDDLTEESQDKILKTKVNFQGIDTSLNELINKNMVKKYEIIDPMSLSRLFENQAISIGNQDAFSSIGYVQDWYIERTICKHHEFAEIKTTEEELIRSEEKVVIIADDSGMGKSTMLTSLAKKIKSCNSNVWVVRINLLDYASKKDRICLEEIDFSKNDTNSAIEFVSKMIIQDNNFTDNLQKQLFAIGLRSTENQSNELTKPQIVLLFDAVDEISPTYKSKVIDLVNALKQSDVKQLVITTRVHIKHDLEDKLELSSYHLDRLDISGQRKFVENFMKWHLKFHKDKHGNVCERPYENILETLTNVKIFALADHIQGIKDKYQRESIEKLEELQQAIEELDFSQYAQHLLEQWNGTFQDNFQTFLQVPLHLTMLIDVIVQNGYQLPQHLQVIDVYDEFINAKFRIKFDDKARIYCGIPSVESATDILSNISREIHCELAVKLIFQRYEEFVLPKLNKLEECQQMIGNMKSAKEDITTFGLLILSDDRLEFIHHSFAEYFFSEYLIVNRNNEHVQKILFEEILHDGYWMGNCYFFNNYVMNKSFDIDLTATAKTFLIDDLQNYKPILHVVAGQNYDGIMKLLLDLYTNVTDREHLARLILTNSQRDGGNILFYTLENNDANRLLHLLNWVRDHLSIDTLKVLVTNDSVRNDKIILSALHNNHLMSALHKVVKCVHKDEKCKFILETLLNYLVEYVADDEFLRDCVLANDRGDGGNILLYMIESHYVGTTQYLLNWVEALFGIDACMHLLLNGRLENGEIFETCLHAAIGYYREKNTEMIEITLDFIVERVANREFWKEIILKNSKKYGANVLYLSLVNYCLEIAPYLWNWMNFHLDIDVIMESIKSAKVGNGIIIENAMHRAVEFHMGQNKTMFELILDFVYENVADQKEFEDLVLSNDNHHYEGLNILSRSFRNEYPETTRFFWNFIKEQLGVTALQLLVKNGQVVDGSFESALYLAIIYKSGRSKEMAELVLNFLNEHTADKEYLKNCLMGRTNEYKWNISTYSMYNESLETTRFIWDWVKEQFGNDTLNELICASDEEGALHFTIKFSQHRQAYEKIKMILNSMNEYVTDENLLREFILSNDKNDGENILYQSIEKQQIPLTLWNWTDERFGIDAIKELIVKGKVIDGVIKESCLHNAVRCNVDEVVDLTLNVIYEHAMDRAFLARFVLDNQNGSEEMINRLLESWHLETTIFLVNWAKAQLEFNQLNKPRDLFDSIKGIFGEKEVQKIRIDAKSHAKSLKKYLKIKYEKPAYLGMIPPYAHIYNPDVWKNSNKTETVNDDKSNENILYYSDDNGLELILCLWDNDQEDVKNNSPMHSATSYKCGENGKELKFILNFIHENVEDTELVETFLAQNDNRNADIFHYSLENIYHVVVIDFNLKRCAISQRQKTRVSRFWNLFSELK